MIKDVIIGKKHRGGGWERSVSDQNVSHVDRSGGTKFAVGKLEGLKPAPDRAVAAANAAGLGYGVAVNRHVLFGEQRGCDAVEGAVGFAECKAAIVAVSAGDVLGAVESGADVGKVVRGDSPFAAFAQWRVQWSGDHGQRFKVVGFWTGAVFNSDGDARQTGVGAAMRAGRLLGMATTGPSLVS
jgi:hypothetical protein